MYKVLLKLDKFFLKNEGGVKLTPPLPGKTTFKKPSLIRVKKSWQSYFNEIYSAIAGGIFITENDRKLLSLAPQLGWLGKSIFEELCEIEYQNSIMIPEHLCNCITDQFRRHEPDPELNTKKKKQIKSVNNDQQKKILKIIRN